MIAELGHFALVLALVAAALQSIIPVWGVHSDNAAAMRFADNAAQVQFLGIAAAFGAVWYLDFGVRPHCAGHHARHGAGSAGNDRCRLPSLHPVHFQSV